MLGLDNPIHIAFLLILVLLVFGAKRLPEMGRSLGSGMRGFRESLTGEGAAHALPAAPAVAAVPQPAQAADPTAAAAVAMGQIPTAPAQQPSSPIAA
jgi:sec-independent protein translocase protein TatA